MPDKVYEVCYIIQVSIDLFSVLTVPIKVAMQLVSASTPTVYFTVAGFPDQSGYHFGIKLPMLSVAPFPDAGYMHRRVSGGAPTFLGSL